MTTHSLFPKFLASLVAGQLRRTQAFNDLINSSKRPRRQLPEDFDTRRILMYTVKNDGKPKDMQGHSMWTAEGFIVLSN